jgi:hypothetical protein
VDSPVLDSRWALTRVSRCSTIDDACLIFPQNDPHGCAFAWRAFSINRSRISPPCDGRSVNPARRFSSHWNSINPSRWFLRCSRHAFTGVICDHSLKCFMLGPSFPNALNQAIKMEERTPLSPQRRRPSSRACGTLRHSRDFAKRQHRSKSGASINCLIGFRPERKESAPFGSASGRRP